jgi:hypothetical protein
MEEETRMSAPSTELQAQLEAALFAADKYAVISADERGRIREAFSALSEEDKDAFVRGRLEAPLAGLPADKRDKMLMLLLSLQARLQLRRDLQN